MMLTNFQVLDFKRSEAWEVKVEIDASHHVFQLTTYTRD